MILCFPISEFNLPSLPLLPISDEGEIYRAEGLVAYCQGFRHSFQTQRYYGILEGSTLLVAEVFRISITIIW